MNKLNNNKVVVYTIPSKQSAVGLHNMTSENGKSLNKTKFGMAADSFSVLYSPTVGGLKTGLYKPWYENGNDVKGDKGETLTLQDRYEKQFGLDKGYLTNRHLPLEGSFASPDKATYFQNFKIVFNDGATVFDLGTLDGLMGYHVMLESKYVANSEKEWRDHKWPQAKYYIALENEEAEIKAQRNTIKSKAFANLHDTVMTYTSKHKLAAILGKAPANTTISTDAINNTLFEIIEKSDYTPTSDISKFNELFNLLKDAKGKFEFEARFALKQSLEARCIFEKQGTYTWIRATGPIIIGDNYTEAVQFFLDPKKDTLVKDLMNEIKAKS